MATRAKPKTNWLKAKVRTERMVVDLEGPLKSSLVHIFIMVGTKEDREKLLKEFHEAHVDMCKREALAPLAGSGRS